MKHKIIFLVGVFSLTQFFSCNNNNRIFIKNNAIAAAHPLASLAGKKNV
jgi:hypothetical protein